MEESSVPKTTESPKTTTQPQKKKHTPLGIAAFIIALIIFIIYFILFAAAGFMEASTPGGIDEESPAAVLLGLCIFGAGFINLIGLGLGIAGVTQKHYKRIFAILGLVFNAVAFVTMAGLILLGLSLG